MKILMVIDSIPRGGKERRMLELVRGLKNHSTLFETYLVSLTDRIEYEEAYTLPDHFEIIKRKSKKDLSVLFKIRKTISKFKPDIIHSWSTMASIYLSLLNVFYRKPFVNGVLADAYANLTMKDKHFLRVKLTTPFTTVFVANSAAGIVAYKTPVQKSVCIYNGINFNRFENLRPPKEMELEILGKEKGGRIVVAMVAGFDSRKDYHTLIRAATNICSYRPNLVFLLIGSGPLLESLKSTIPDYLLNNQIIFTGKRNDIESILQIADIGALITFYEGISNAIIEYMAMGKPVLATKGGGTSELVLDGVNGFLLDQNNDLQIVEKLDWLLDHPDERTEMGIRGYHWVRKQFSIVDKTEEYVELYTGLVSNRRVYHSKN